MNQATSYEELAEWVGSDRATVFIFTADWCGDCQFIYPFLDQLAADFPGFGFVQVDRDRFMGLAQEWGIFGIPSLVVTRGGREIARLVNRHRKTRETLTAFLRQVEKENR